MTDFNGKVAVVTGAGGGIGSALAARCVARGMSVVLADLHADSLGPVAEQLTAGGASVLAVPTDVSDEASMAALRDAAYERFGTVHLVCNNAGVIGGLAHTWEVPASEWRWVFGVNVMGVVNGINAFVPRLVEQGDGYVLNTASEAGVAAGSAASAYSATKHAVVSLSESLANDLAMLASPVGVTVLCPGPVGTKIYESARHRPTGVTAPSGEYTDMLSAATTSLITGGVSPEEIAEFAFGAIDERRFYALSDPETILPRVRSRFEAILAGGGVADSRHDEVLSAGSDH